jgi:rubrerythrin
MNAAIQQVAEGLFKAMKAEGDGYHFYTMAAMQTSDAKGKEILNALAREEWHHQNFLRAQYQALLDHGQIDRTLQLEKRLDLKGESPIFSGEFKTRLKDAGFEMSILSIAIQLEYTSMNFYRAEANKAKEEAVQKFYQELAEWESDHYEALLRQQDALKEDYWKEAGFSPF